MARDISEPYASLQVAQAVCQSFFSEHNHLYSHCLHFHIPSPLFPQDSKHPHIHLSYFKKFSSYLFYGKFFLRNFTHPCVTLLALSLLAMPTGYFLILAGSDFPWFLPMGASPSSLSSLSFTPLVRVSRPLHVCSPCFSHSHGLLSTPRHYQTHTVKITFFNTFPKCFFPAFSVLGNHWRDQFRKPGCSWSPPLCNFHAHCPLAGPWLCISLGLLASHLPQHFLLQPLLILLFSLSFP